MRTKIGIAGVLMMAAFCGFEVYHNTGVVHATRKNGFGCLCHGFDPTGSVNVWIAGPDSLRAGGLALYTVNIARAGNIAGGFNVAAWYGSLGISDTTGTMLERESSTDSLELTHRLPRLRSGRDTISWNFYYKAPLSPNVTDTIYAAGNSVNNDTLPDGDFWNFSPHFLVRVLSPTSVAGEPLIRSYRVFQNYPNPFNPSTRIKFELPEPSEVSLVVYDALGRKLAELARGRYDAGYYSAIWNLAHSGIASGVYFAQFTATDAKGNARFNQVSKLLLSK